MDCSKVGALLLRLRKEKGMTQKQVADQMNLSDKTISKWERGLGCPDVSLLGSLSKIFEVNIDKLLEGDLESNEYDPGNLRRMKFYVCPNCGNVIHATGNAEVFCCGRKLSPLIAKPADKFHLPTISETEGEYYITFSHEMTKAHFLSFVAYVISDRFLFMKLYPEQNAAVRFPNLGTGKLLKKHNGTLFFYCTKDGFFAF